MNNPLKLLIPAVAAILTAASCSLIEGLNGPKEFSFEGASSAEVSAATQDIDFSFRCDKEWTASLKGGRFVKLLRESVAEDGIGGAVTVRVSLNESETLRRDTLVITSGSKSMSAVISQKGLSSYLSATELVLSEAGSSLLIHAPYNWKLIAQDGDWFTIDPAEGAKGSVTVTFKANPRPEGEYDPRNGVAVFSCGHDHINISLSQGQKDALLVSAEEIPTVALGGTFSLQALYNVDYSVEIGVDWIHQEGTKALSEDSYTFRVDENTAETERSGVIRFLADGLEAAVTVTQAGRDPLLGLETYGLYNETTPVTLYEPGICQLGRYYDDTSLNFRIMDIEAGTVTDIRGYGIDLRPGDTVTLEVVTQEGRTSHEAVLLATEGERAWLRAKDGTGFILKI